MVFARLRFTFDDTAMVADDLGTSARPSPLPVALVVTKRIETGSAADPPARRTVVLDAEFSGSDTRDFFPGIDRRDAGPERVVSWIFAALPRSTTASAASSRG